MKVDNSIQSVTLGYEATARDGRTLAETLETDLATDSLAQNEYVQFSTERVQRTKVATFLALFISAIASFYSKVNSSRALKAINEKLGTSFESISEAQTAYQKRENGDGKRFQLGDALLLSEPEVIRGIIGTKNVAKSPYMEIADNLAKQAKRFVGYEDGVSEQDRVDVLNVAVNRWLQSESNPHREFAMSEYYATATASGNGHSKEIVNETVKETVKA